MSVMPTSDAQTFWAQAVGTTETNQEQEKQKGVWL